MYFVLFFLVFAQLRLRQNRPRLFGIAEDSPLFSGLQHLTSCLSASCALFSLTAIFQPFSFQSLPHSFHPDGGCTPSLHIRMVLYTDLYAKSFGIKFFANPHQLTLMESHSYKNLGGALLLTRNPGKVPFVHPGGTHEGPVAGSVCPACPALRGEQHRGVRPAPPPLISLLLYILASLLLSSSHERHF